MSRENPFFLIFLHKNLDKADNRHIWVTTDQVWIDLTYGSKYHFVVIWESNLSLAAGIPVGTTFYPEVFIGQHHFPGVPDLWIYKN
jgi:hypothetical protein